MPIAAARATGLLLAALLAVSGCRRAAEEQAPPQGAPEPTSRTQPADPSQPVDQIQPAPHDQSAPLPAEAVAPPTAAAPASDPPEAAGEEGSPISALGIPDVQPADASPPARAPEPGQPDCAAAIGKELTAERFKKDVACRIHARNTGHLYDGAPPPILRSVVVLSVRIDAKGKPVRIVVVRSNGIRVLERRAIESVRLAAPLPLPGALALRQGSAEITETWLFRDDGRFRVRTLAAVQAQSGF